MVSSGGFEEKNAAQTQATFSDTLENELLSSNPKATKCEAVVNCCEPLATQDMVPSHIFRG